MNEMRKLMEAVNQIDEATAAPAFEIGKTMYVLYIPKDKMFGITDMGAPSRSEVPKKSGMSDTKAGAEHKRDLIIANLKRNSDKYPRNKKTYMRQARAVKKWVVIKLTMSLA